MTLPLREYYPVARAAELLGCKVEDLFHWAEIGAINLYVPFDNGKGYVHFCNDSDGLKENYINSLLVSDGASYVHHIYNDEDKSHIDFFNKKPPIDKTLPCFFNGFWSLTQQAFGFGCLYDIKPSIYDIWQSSNKTMFIVFEDNDYLSFEDNDFYLMKYDFKKINNCNVDELPNYYNGGVIKPYINNGSVDKIGKPHVADYHAKKRESVLKAAIYMKENHPDLCGNNTKWAEAINDHASKFWENGELPLSVDVIAKLLGEALRAIR